MAEATQLEVSAFFFTFRFDDLEHYRENNRLEAKKAQGGLPRSIWETYSAFANTQGGVILLGVEELPDKTLHVAGLPGPEKLLADFWNTVNNPEKVSVNILSESDVRVDEADGKRVISIEVLRAQRGDKPVYINNNLLSGTYRRNGEGDYHCTKAEVQAMLRDAAIKTQDMLVLESMDLSVFDYESVSRYRLRMKIVRPDHVWENLKDDEFLYKLGAIGRGEDGQLHPTCAGLLMFGFEYEIVREYPQYFLDYQEQLDASMRGRTASSPVPASGAGTSMTFTSGCTTAFRRRSRFPSSWRVGYALMIPPSTKPCARCWRTA